MSRLHSNWRANSNGCSVGQEDENASWGLWGLGDDIPHRVKTEQLQRTVSLGKGFTNLKLVDLVSVVVIQGKLVIKLNNLLFECW